MPNSSRAPDAVPRCGSWGCPLRPGPGMLRSHKAMQGADKRTPSSRNPQAGLRGRKGTPRSNRPANPGGVEVGGRWRESCREPMNRRSEIRHCSIIGNYCQYQRNHRSAKTIVDHFFRLCAKNRATISREPGHCSVDGTRDPLAAELERQGWRNSGDCSVDGTRDASE
jgi:hypothetical protein